MSLIEQAAKRLEELKRAGVELPVSALSPPPAAGTTVAAAMERQAHEAAARELKPAVTPPPAQAVEPDDAVEKRISRTVDIDLARLERMGYLSPQAPRSQLADEFRVIKRPLLNNVQGKSATPVARANLIMVTSSLAGEGKTFVSTNLAMSMALELDTRVLLVEADPSRPATFERLGLKGGKGLLDVLSSDIDVTEVLLRTNVDKLSLMPVGTASEHATELLASGAMQRLLDELASRYADRVIVFDAPPLLPTPEARALAAFMGQIVLVVESSRTAQGTVIQSLDMLEKCPVVMSVLNKSRGVNAGSNFAYYAY